MSKKVMLLILDGWGIGKKPDRSAIFAAQTPVINNLLDTYPNATLLTHGGNVGLPDGQMGNSEVGHINIGAGRVIYQELARINKAIVDGELQTHPVLLDAIRKAKERNAAIHLMGLVSDGGVHSHIKHLFALCDICEAVEATDVFVHAFLDGRDTDPKSGNEFLSQLLDHTKDQNVKLATVLGRYYAMDRDNRWERTKKCYDLIVNGIGEKTDDVLETIEAYYEKNITDEFMESLIVNEHGFIKDGDLVIFFNFRTDRPRQLTKVLSQQEIETHDMKPLNIDMVTFTKYDEEFEGIDVLFEKDNLNNSIGEVIAANGLKQLRIAETEKYPHVSFFFSGGREEPFTNEHRILVPSPKVATYDLQPEMSANEITERLLEFVQSDAPDFVCLNFANTDMVGHTGDFTAAVIAAETVDACVGKIIETALPQGYQFIIIADHGNSDYMINDDGSPNTAHTINPVPIIYVSNDAKNKEIQDGILADVAPTILSLMGVEKPSEMTGKVLVE